MYKILIIDNAREFDLNKLIEKKEIGICHGLIFTSQKNITVL